MTVAPDSNTAALIRFDHFQAKRDERYQTAKSEWADTINANPAELLDYMEIPEERELLLNILCCLDRGDLLAFGADASDEIDQYIDRIAARKAQQEVDGG